MLTWKIGNVTISRIVEIELPGLTFILPDATPENVSQIDWLAPHFVTAEHEPIASVQTFIVESQGRCIMVDTCIGNDKSGLPIRPWNGRTGPFLQDLEASGFPRDSIDTVLCTHLHMDHVGWNTVLEDGKWKPTFPEARYLFGRVEWEHWSANRDAHAPSMLQESVDPIVEADLHTLVETEHRLTDEVWLEPTPGHTPGHVSVRIASQGEEAVITGDLMHHPCQMARPTWKCTADTDADQAVATRKSFLERFAETPVLIIGTHFAAPTAGKIIRDGDVYRLDL